MFNLRDMSPGHLFGGKPQGFGQQLPLLRTGRKSPQRNRLDNPLVLPP
jgi:hypothetical protein